MVHSDGRPIKWRDDWWVRVSCPHCDESHYHRESDYGRELQAPCGSGSYRLITSGE